MALALSLGVPGGLWTSRASASTEERAHREEDGDAGWGHVPRGSVPRPVDGTGSHRDKRS